MTEWNHTLARDSGLIDCYQRMLVIRYFEEALSDLFTRNLLGGTSHFCIGQEACAVGVVCETRSDDILVSNHRGHGHLLARGLDPVRVMAELLGAAEGYCGGRGGSQHMCSMSHHFLGTNGITGGGIPIGTGAGLALKRRDTGQISVVFLGDGASNQGTFHESLNMASLWGLPVLYVCENNGYAMSQPLVESSAIPRIAEKASAYRMPGEAVDGMDIRTVRETARAAVEYVRSGNGPMLLELLTYRFCGHSKNDARAYRTREEEGEWAERDCLRIAEEALGEVGVSAAAIEATRDAAARHIDDVVSRALRCSPGDHDHAVGGVYA